jgi:hypothetical protein
MKEIATLFAFAYVLSSGPTRPFAYIVHSETCERGGQVVIEDTILPTPWWHTVYAPLIWESNQPSGSWLGSYWDLFPTPDR